MNFSPLTQEQQTTISKVLYLNSYHITGPVHNVFYVKNTFIESTTAFLISFQNNVVILDGSDYDLWDLLTDSKDRRFFNAIVKAQDQALPTYVHPAHNKPLYVNLLDFFDDLLEEQHKLEQNSDSDEQDEYPLSDQDCSYDDLDFFCNEI